MLFEPQQLVMFGFRQNLDKADVEKMITILLMNTIDGILNIDTIKLCDRCKGNGFLTIKNFDTLESKREACTKCSGSGRLRVSGVLKVTPFEPKNIEK